MGCKSVITYVADTKVHFGVDESGRDSQRRIMELVRDMQVDVLGLLETDRT